MDKTQAKQRLEYLRQEIQAERISYGEIAELQSLINFIEEGDTELLEWAGAEETSEDDTCYHCDRNLNDEKDKGTDKQKECKNCF